MSEDTDEFLTLVMNIYYRAQQGKTGSGVLDCDCELTLPLSSVEGDVCLGPDRENGEILHLIYEDKTLDLLCPRDFASSSSLATTISRVAILEAKNRGEVVRSDANEVGRLQPGRGFH